MTTIKSIMSFRKVRAVCWQAPLRRERGWGEVLISLSFLLIVPIALNAQKSDSLAPLRDFVAVCNGYKQIPMYLSMEMKNSTNLVMNETDTTTAQGEFFLQDKNSYVRFGEFEQVVNDSLALLVSDNLQQMILYTDAAPVVAMMRKMMGAAVPDSSIRKLSEKYSSTTKALSKTAAAIELNSRAVIYNTSLPKESIELKYDVKQRTPQQVTTISRRLLELDSLQYEELKLDSLLAKNLLMEEGSYFLIKEQFTVWLYKKIQYPYTGMVPVLVSDRIIKDNEGEYIPVKKYEAYGLTKND
jgi:hypothetical protein